MVDSATFGGLNAPVNQARCSNKLRDHLDHLRETNDLFGNLAKSKSEGKGMSLLLKVVADEIDPVMASFELRLCDLRGTIEKRTSGAKALINRLFCTTRLMPFVQSIFPHPQPTSRSRRAKRLRREPPSRRRRLSGAQCVDASPQRQPQTPRNVLVPRRRIRHGLRIFS